MNSDPTYNINIAGDIKQMLQELGTEKGKQTALLGGGGSKAQKERAAALAAILAARSRIKEDSKSDSNGNAKVTQGFSIVDAASASVHGRSAAAAKAASGDKTAARIAMHMAGDRAPVNAKLVSVFFFFLCRNSVLFSLFFLLKINKGSSSTKHFGLKAQINDYYEFYIQSLPLSQELTFKEYGSHMSNNQEIPSNFLANLVFIHHTQLI